MIALSSFSICNEPYATCFAVSCTPRVVEKISVFMLHIIVFRPSVLYHWDVWCPILSGSQWQPALVLLETTENVGSVPFPFQSVFSVCSNFEQIQDNLAVGSSYYMSGVVPVMYRVRGYKYYHAETSFPQVWNSSCELKFGGHNWKYETGCFSRCS